MRRIFPIILIAFFALSIPMCSAGTIQVPADQPTIQAGIDAAVVGDTVLVANGTYLGPGNTGLDYLGKEIIVMSENGPEFTIIDCEETDRAFYFHNDEGESAVVRGFTITNGSAEVWGAGIFCSSTSPTILECKFENNIARWGGGIACDNHAMPTIEDCIFIGNTGTDYAGGIILDNDCHATISRCEFYQNEAYTGAAIRCGAASPSISQCVISENFAENNGGGIELRLDSNPEIVDCIIINNHAGNEAGGVKVGETSHPTIQRCLIAENTAEGPGGGVMVRNNAGPLFENCTICNNVSCSGAGGGVAVQLEAFPTFHNTILWDDEPGEIDIESGSIAITYSDVESGWAGEGNIDDDPLFADGEPYDYHLTEGSPCIDSGDPDSPPDPDGSRADMGAFYYNQPGPLFLAVEPDSNYFHRGGLLGFTVIVTNNSESTISFQGWTAAETPWGDFLSPLLGPINVILGPHQTIAPHISQQIPGHALFGGPYIYTVAAGEYPDGVFAEDSFEFFIVPSLLEQRYDDWEVLEGKVW